MPARHAICIVVDGLRASALGCYGNTWAPTPALDQMASQSLVVDWMTCDSPYLEDFYHSVWHGCPAWSQAPTPDAVSPVLSDVLKDADVAVSCVTDATHLATIWPELANIPTFRPAKTSPGAPAPCAIHQLFETAVSHLADAMFTSDSSSPVSNLVWIHACGLHAAWDAPLERRGELLDEEDPPPLEFSSVPERIETSDPDEALSYRAAYAAQVGVLDEALAGLLAVIAEWQATNDSLVVLVGARGFALGEHRVIGANCDDLYSELLHVPLLLTAPGLSAPQRWQPLLQPFDLGSLLAAWFAGDGASSASSDADDCIAGALAGRDMSIAKNRRGEVAVRTPAWLMIGQASDSSDEEDLGGPGDPAQLFVKPDDRWEANEIAALRGEVLHAIQSAFEAAEPWPPSRGSETLELAPELIEPER